MKLIDCVRLIMDRFRKSKYYRDVIANFFDYNLKLLYTFLCILQGTNSLVVSHEYRHDVVCHGHAILNSKSI